MVSNEIMRWHYVVWQQFFAQIHATCLTQEDIQHDGQEFDLGNVIILNADEDGSIERTEDYPLNRKCIKVKKNGKLYWVPIEFEKEMPFRVTGFRELRLKASDLNVYRFVDNIQSIKIPANKVGTFRQFIDEWNPMDHANHASWTLLKLMSIGSLCKSIKLCVCGAPALGKNSNLTLLMYITGNVINIKKPTLAKLETAMYYNRVIVPDEISSMSSAALQEIEPLFLGVADETPQLEKHSMAKKQNMNKIDLTMLSVIFTYNRKQDLQLGDRTFDEAWRNKAAFQSRYPQLVLEGEVTQKLKKLNTNEARQIAIDNMDYLKQKASELQYWLENLYREQHKYNRDVISKLSNRHSANIEGLIDALDAYCDNQDMFDVWCQLILKAIDQYNKEER